MIIQQNPRLLQLLLRANIPRDPRRLGSIASRPRRRRLYGLRRVDGVQDRHFHQLELYLTRSRVRGRVILVF